MLGKDLTRDLVIATNGGSDRLHSQQGPQAADRTIKALLEQDYVSASLSTMSEFPGTLPMSQLGLKGKAVVPHPRSWSICLVIGMRRADQLLGAHSRHCSQG